MARRSVASRYTTRNTAQSRSQRGVAVHASRGSRNHVLLRYFLKVEGCQQSQGRQTNKGVHDMVRSSTHGYHGEYHGDTTHQNSYYNHRLRSASFRRDFQMSDVRCSMNKENRDRSNCSYFGLIIAGLFRSTQSLASFLRALAMCSCSICGPMHQT